MMDSGTVSRKTLGRGASLCDLYDVRQDVFCGVSLLKSAPPKVAITSQDIPHIHSEYTNAQTYKEKFGKLNVEASLKISVLGSLFSLSGSGKYLDDEATSEKIVRGTLIYNITTKEDSINLLHSELRPHVITQHLSSGEATHVVSKIRWGANVFVTFEMKVRDHSRVKELEVMLKASLSKIPKELAELGGKAGFERSKADKEVDESFSTKVQGDVVPDDQPAPQSVEQVLSLMRKIPQYVKKFNEGKGKALEIELYPIKLLAKHFGVVIQVDKLMNDIDLATIKVVESEIDNSVLQKQILNDFVAEVKDFSEHVSEDDLQECLKYQNNVDIANSKFRGDLRQAILAIRQKGSATSVLDDVIQEYKLNPHGPHTIDIFLHKKSDLKTKMDFFQVMKEKNVEFLPKSKSITSFVARHDDGVLYVLHYSEKLRETQKEGWQTAHSVFMDQIKERNEVLKTTDAGIGVISSPDSLSTKFLVVDATLHPTEGHTSIRIVEYVNGRLVTDDVVRNKASAVTQNIIWWDRIDKFSSPTQNVPTVMLICPFAIESKCKAQKRQWTCHRCNQSMDYDFSDHFYCECGGVLVRDCRFKCCDPHHGSRFGSFTSLEELKKHLPKSWPSSVNILLLGETGVETSLLAPSSLMMDSGTLSRKTLGRGASLCDLYDVRQDVFCGVSLLNSAPPKVAITSQQVPDMHIDYTDDDTYHEKFHKLNVEASLKISVLGGLFSLSGSGKYLNDEATSQKIVRGTLIYKITTKEDSINLLHSELRPHVITQHLSSGEATHVVSKIRWGANVFVTFEMKVGDYSRVKEIRRMLQASLWKVYKELIEPEGKGEAGYSKQVEESFSIKVQGDVVPDDCTAPQSVEQFLSLMRRIPQYVKKFNEGKGKPLEIELYPIKLLAKHFGVVIQEDLMYDIDLATIAIVESVIDNSVLQKQILNDFVADVRDFSEHVSGDDLLECLNYQNNVNIADSKFRGDLRQAILAIRQKGSAASVLDDVIQEYKLNPHGPHTIDIFLDKKNDLKTKMDFFQVMKEEKVKFLRKCKSIDSFVARHDDGVVYVLHYSDKLRETHKEGWPTAYSVFLDKIKERNEALKTTDVGIGVNSTPSSLLTEFLVVDATLHPTDIHTSIRIVKYFNGSLVTDDVVWDEASQNIIWWDRIDRVGNSPQNLAPVKLMCPFSIQSKSNAQHRHWICHRCNQRMGYGYPSHFYCNCGGVRVRDCRFKCCDPYQFVSITTTDEEVMMEPRSPFEMSKHIFEISKIIRREMLG